MTSAQLTQIRFRAFCSSLGAKLTKDMVKNHGVTRQEWKKGAPAKQ